MSVSDPEVRALENVIRAVAAAAKSLRLYPASSPIPRQSIEAADAALTELMQTQSQVRLVVGREGFLHAGAELASGAQGALDLAGTLRSHGVAELDLMLGCGADELLGLLDIIMRDPEEVRAAGGVASAIAAAGLSTVRVSEVTLTVAEESLLDTELDVDEFLRSLATDPEKLAIWLRAAVKGDPATLEEGLADLAKAAGADGFELLVSAFTGAFGGLEQDGKDSIIGLALEAGTTQTLMAGVLSNFKSENIASTLADGLYGRNMLSMSNVLDKLPLGSQLDAVIADVRKSILEGGRSSKEADFLGHMLETRRSQTPEPALVDAQPAYSSVAELAQVSEDEVAKVRSELAGSVEQSDTRTVRTMRTLLDQQSDYGLYCETLDSLAGLVPVLIERGELSIAVNVLSDLAERESRAVQPWPELTGRLQTAITSATSERAMVALLAAIVSDRGRLADARSILQAGGTPAQQSLVEHALAEPEGEGLALADELLGRHLVDILGALAPNARVSQLAAIAGRLAADGGPRSTQTIDALLRRPDAESRKEIARGLAESGTESAQRFLATLLRDSDTEVAIAAARAAARMSTPGTAALLGARIDELDVDGKDFELASEIIGALARTPDDDAEPLLKLSERKALIKRGHFAEVQSLVTQALAMRERGGGAR